MIVIVTPTIQDGTVVRWYRNEWEAENRSVQISASRNAVKIHGTLEVDDWFDEVVPQARQAHEVLRQNHDADMNHLATHRRNGLVGPLVPVEHAKAWHRCSPIPVAPAGTEDRP